MFVNWQYRVLAVVLALLCWYLVTGREKVETWVEVPVELVATPEDLFVREGLESSLKVRVRGPKSIIRGLDPKGLAYTVDMSRAAAGEMVAPFETDQIKVPKSLEVVELSPQRMTLVIDRLARKTVPVDPVWKGRIGDDYRLLSAAAAPAEVDLRGPAQVLDRLERVQTLAVSVNSTEPRAVGADAALSLPAEVRADPAKVRVELQFGLKTRDVWVRLPVEVLPPALAGASVRPSTVQIYVEAPVTLLREPDFKERFSAYVVLEHNATAGRRVAAYRLRLPPDVTLHKAVPDEVEISVDNHRK
ncbi:MAG: CdaR family protein [Thermodesulfobacteriota bacterium]